MRALLFIALAAASYPTWSLHWQAGNDPPASGMEAEVLTIPSGYFYSFWTPAREPDGTFRTTIPLPPGTTGEHTGTLRAVNGREKSAPSLPLTFTVPAPPQRLEEFAALATLGGLLAYRRRPIRPIMGVPGRRAMTCDHTNELCHCGFVRDDPKHNFDLCSDRSCRLIADLKDQLARSARYVLATRDVNLAEALIAQKVLAQYGNEPEKYTHRDAR